MKPALMTFDNGLSRWIQSLPAWLGPIMVTLSFLGLPIVVIILATAAVAVAFREHQTKLALSFAAVLGGLGVNTLLKLSLHRTRPDTLYVGTMKIKSFSFPSGHAYGAAALYGLLAYLAWHTLPSPWNAIVSSLLVLLIFLIGFSRVYLGAHFPTDVLGGWILGGLTVLIIVIFLRPLT